VSLAPVVHLELRISLRIFKKMQNGTDGINRTWGRWFIENTGSKKSYDTIPFQATGKVEAANYRFANVCGQNGTACSAIVQYFLKRPPRVLAVLTVDFTVLTQDKHGTEKRGLLLPSAQTKSTLSKFTKKRELTIRQKLNELLFYY
jgi:hypothetical protein